MPTTRLEWTDEELGLTDGWDKNTDGTPLDTNIRRELRGARQARKEAELARDEANAAKRSLTLIRAGIPDNKQGAVFDKVYDGELEPEAVQAAWVELFGPLESSGSTPDLTAAQRIQNATAGHQEPNGGVIDLKDALLAAKGDPAKVREIIRNAPAAAGIGLPEIQ